MGPQGPTLELAEAKRERNQEYDARKGKKYFRGGRGSWRAKADMLQGVACSLPNLAGSTKKRLAREQIKVANEMPGKERTNSLSRRRNERATQRSGKVRAGVCEDKRW